MSEYNKIASIYDVLHGNKNYESEVDYIIDIATKNFGIKNKEVLDVGCGTGKHLEIFSNKGYKICGVDISEEMIEEAKKRLGKDANLIYGNVDEVKERYSLVISMFNVINHILDDYENLEKFFCSVSNKLKKGGIFIFDCFNKSAYVKESPKSLIKELNSGAVLTVTPMVNYDESTLDLRCNYDNNFNYEIKHKIWHTNTIIVAMLKSGLSPQGIFKHFDMKEANNDDYKMIFVCKKVRKTL